MDRAILAAVLEDLAHWTEATFGELEGVIEVEARADMTAEEIRVLASNIANQLSDELVSAFIERNRSSA